MLKRVAVLAIVLVGAATAGAAAQGGAPMVSGRVFDDTTGCPLRGATISAVGSPAKTMTDAQGRYYLKGAPSTPFTLQAVLTGYQSQANDNVVAPDSATRVDFSLLRAVESAGRPRVRYPTMKCVLDRRDSAQAVLGRR